MAYLKTELETKYAESIPTGSDDDNENEKLKVIVHAASSFEGYFTYDGIDVCGIRVANEIQEKIYQLNNDDAQTRVVKLSVIGYSLGGLISRYALGLLYLRGLFEEIEPVNFTTFASPHVGVLALGTGLASRLFNYLAPFTLAYTSRQLFLTDEVFVHDGKPLLYCLADPQLPFFQALAKFKSCSLYGNIVNDHRTEWYTSGIDVADPFARNASYIRGPYLPGYGPILIDYYKPLQLAYSRDIGKLVASNAASSEVFTKRWGLRQIGSRVLRWTALFINITIVMPVWLTASLINSAFQTASACLRKRSFLKSDIFSAFHGDTLLQALSSANKTEEEGEQEEEEEEELPTISDQFTEQAGVVLESVLEAVKYQSEIDLPSLTNKDQSISDRESATIASETSLAVVEESKLHLNATQLAIISFLNKLPWKKFPVHIRQAKHTHAALICRYPSPQFDEGKVIVKQWVDDVFIPV